MERERVPLRAGVNTAVSTYSATCYSAASAELLKAAEAALPAASAELTEWKEDVLYQLLEKVTVLDEARIKVTFRSGVEIEQALEKDERSVTA